MKGTIAVDLFFAVVNEDIDGVWKKNNIGIDQQYVLLQFVLVPIKCHHKIVCVFLCDKVSNKEADTMQSTYFPFTRLQYKGSLAFKTLLQLCEGLFSGENSLLDCLNPVVLMCHIIK